MTPAQWVDRVFTLQHNGGSFLNKINWGPQNNQTGYELTSVLGPAHASDPPDLETLRSYVRPGALDIWSDWLKISNKNRQRWRLPLWRDRTFGISSYELSSMYGWLRYILFESWNDIFGEEKHPQKFTYLKKLAGNHELTVESLHPEGGQQQWLREGPGLRYKRLYRFGDACISTFGAGIPWHRDTELKYEIAKGLLGGRPPVTPAEVVAHIGPRWHETPRAHLSTKKYIAFCEKWGIEPELVAPPKPDPGLIFDEVSTIDFSKFASFAAKPPKPQSMGSVFAAKTMITGGWTTETISTTKTISGGKW
jgi:hypothetical protein